MEETANSSIRGNVAGAIPNPCPGIGDVSGLYETWGPGDERHYWPVPERNVPDEYGEVGDMELLFRILCDLQIHTLQSDGTFTLI